MEILDALMPLLSEGFINITKVFFLTLVLSIPLSIPVAMARLSKNKILSKLVGMYIYLMRGTPLLLQLMFIFFGLPLLPGAITLDRFTAIYVAFILNYTAYLSEIFRGGIQSIDKGQWEAAKVLGVSKPYTFIKIILPQAFSKVVPAVSNEVINLVKDTSLTYILGIMDLLKAARSISNTMASIVPYVIVGIIYLIIIAVLTYILDKVERKAQY
ncbi:MAG: amino acid ABC transporter permease [Finegoldia sp.]|nr:amino acid ABC transporter permease [Finegoldia sp.]